MGKKTGAATAQKKYVNASDEYTLGEGTTVKFADAPVYQRPVSTKKLEAEALQVAQLFIDEGVNINQEHLPEDYHLIIGGAPYRPTAEDKPLPEFVMAYREVELYQFDCDDKIHADTLYPVKIVYQTYTGAVTVYVNQHTFGGNISDLDDFSYVEKTITLNKDGEQTGELDNALFNPSGEIMAKDASMFTIMRTAESYMWIRLNLPRTFL